MSCEFTEEVSLLVDGELPTDEAARLRAHMEGCAACEQARDAFLLLRQELRSYDFAPDPRAQTKALAAILDSRTRIAGAAPRAKAWELWERLGGAFGGRGLRPAHAATLALLLIATALGLRWLVGSNTSPRTRQSEAPALANKDSRPVQAGAAAEDKEKRSKESAAVESPTVYQAKTKRRPRLAGAKPSLRVTPESARARRDDYRTVRPRREGLNVEAPQETARVETPGLRPSPAGAPPAPAGEAGNRGGQE